MTRKTVTTLMIAMVSTMMCATFAPKASHAAPAPEPAPAPPPPPPDLDDCKTLERWLDPCIDQSSKYWPDAVQCCAAFPNDLTILCTPSGQVNPEVICPAGGAPAAAVEEAPAGS